MGEHRAFLGERVSAVSFLQANSFNVRPERRGGGGSGLWPDVRLSLPGSKTNSRHANNVYWASILCPGMNILEVFMHISSSRHCQPWSPTRM